MNPKAYVESLDLPMGKVHRGNCPVCNRRNTFTAINDMGKLMWNCYASSCNVAGSIHTTISAADLQKLMRDQYVHKDLPVDFDLPDWIIVDYERKGLKDLCYRWQLDPHWLDLRYDIREERVVFPVREGGKLVDAVGRGVHSGVIPKWKRYGVARTAYVVGDTDIAVVVEDCISAAVVDTLGGTGFALLGTALLEEHKQLLAKYRKVVVALDPDAMSKTLVYTRELKAIGIEAVAMNLLDDLKYRVPDDIAQLLNRMRS